MAGWRSELAGCRSTLSILKIKLNFSETKFLSFYKTLGFSQCFGVMYRRCGHIMPPHTQASFKSSAVFGLIEVHVLVDPICSFVSYLIPQIDGNNPIESVNRENLYILIIRILKYLLYWMVRNHKQAIIHCKTLNWNLKYISFYNVVPKHRLFSFT